MPSCFPGCPCHSVPPVTQYDGRVSLSALQTTLISTDRWRWLLDVLDRWYAVPLSSEDGATPAEIAEAVVAMRLDDQPRWDAGLPDVLAEWFQLVAHRLHSVEGGPATLPELWGDPGGVLVWWDGSWGLLVDQTGSCFIDDDEFEFPPVPLPAVLHAMVLSDTVDGVWSAAQNSLGGERVGPLGRIADKVRGGMIRDDASRNWTLIMAVYDELPVLPNPYLGLPHRGDAETVIRWFEEDDGSTGIEWMTASDTAFARFTEVVDVDPPGGEYEVLLQFTGLAPELLASVCKPGFAPHTERVVVPVRRSVLKRFEDAVKGLGHLGVAPSEPNEVQLYVTTVMANEVAAALWSAIPEQLVSHAVIAVRPQGLATFRVVFGNPS